MARQTTKTDDGCSYSVAIATGTVTALGASESPSRAEPTMAPDAHSSVRSII